MSRKKEYKPSKKREMRLKQLKEYQNKLWSEIVTDPDKIDSFLEIWRGKFHNYSLLNTLLILWQKPDATLIAGYKAWKKNHNRQVRSIKSGTTTIWIWCPRPYKTTVEDAKGEEKVIEKVSFVPCNVYDVSDTEGDPIDVGCSKMITGELSFKKVAKASLRKVEMKDLGLANGMTDGKTNWITPKDNEVAMSSTLVHEEAHNELGHVDEDFKTLGERAWQEIEAETCKYIVMSYYGVKDERAKYYIGQWSKNLDNLEGKEIEVIQTADRIIRRIENVEV